VVPRALLRAFVTARYLMDRQPSTLSQAVVAAFMEEGHFAAHIRRMRLQHRDQRDELVAAIKSRLGADLTVMRRTKRCISLPSRGEVSRTSPSSAPDAKTASSFGP
jgi:DNA-binding transcriptional MocR family regulator